MDREIGDRPVHRARVGVYRAVFETQPHRLRAILSGPSNPVIDEYPEEILQLYRFFRDNNEVYFTRNQLEGLYDLAISCHEMSLIRFIERRLREWNIWQPDEFLTFSLNVRCLFAVSVTVTTKNVEKLLALANAGDGDTMASHLLQQKCDQFLCNPAKFRILSQNQSNNAICRLKEIIINMLQTSDNRFWSTYTRWVNNLHRDSLNSDNQFPLFEILLDYFDLCASYPPCLLDVWTLESLVEVIKLQLSWFRKTRVSLDTLDTKFLKRFQKCIDTLDQHREQFGDLWRLFCINLADRHQFGIRFCRFGLWKPVENVTIEWKTMLSHWEKLGPDFVQRFAINFCPWLENLNKFCQWPLYFLCNNPAYVSFFETLARTEYIAQRKRSLGEKILESHWLMFEIRVRAPVLGQFYFDDNLEEHLFDVIKVEGFRFKSREMRRVVGDLSSGKARLVDLESKFAEYVHLDFYDIAIYINLFSPRPKMMMVVGKLLAKEIETRYCQPKFFKTIGSTLAIDALKKVDGFAYLDPCPLWALFAFYDQAQEYREQILEPRNFDQYVTHRIRTDGFDFACEHKGMQRIVDCLAMNEPRYVKFELEFAQNARLTEQNVELFARKFKTRPQMLEALKWFESQQKREGNSVADPTSTKKQRTE